MKYAILFFAGILAASCGHRQHGPASNASLQAGDSTSVVYACPMDCEKGKTYNRPGKCPVCEMDLEAKAVEKPAGQQNPEVKALSDATGAIHDEAMKEMAEMNRIGRRLKEVMKTARMTKELSDRYVTVLTDMEKAEAGMMDWMTQYKEPEGGPEEALRYLQEQKQKIEQSKKDIHAALEAGNMLLEK